MRRRQVLAAAGAALVAGCIFGDEYDPEAVRAGASVHAYGDLLDGTVDEGAYLHYPHAWVRNSYGQAPGQNLEVFTEEENGDWINDVFAEWIGDESFDGGEEIEFWAVFEGHHQHDEHRNGRTVPRVTMVDYEPV